MLLNIHPTQEYCRNKLRGQKKEKALAKEIEHKDLGVVKKNEVFTESKVIYSIIYQIPIAH